MSCLPLISDPNLIAGIEHARDAGIYKLNDELALVQTVDFFTPIVDDPYYFGQIAAANSLSDVYAMGGRPLTAMNIVCFPIKTMDISVFQDMLCGGLDKLREAGVVLVGGHSVDDPQLKFGLSVTGLIHPSKVVLNTSVKPGDKLILTKPLGTGIISTAIKRGVAGDETVARIVTSMATLNRKASELMVEAGAHACTDITGFGLLGHASAMVEGSDVGMVIYSAQVPYFPEAKELAEAGVVPGGLGRNRDFRIKMVDLDPKVPTYMADLLFDPQTSGGLLISIDPKKADALLKKLRRSGVSDAAIIGEIVSQQKGRISVR